MSGAPPPASLLYSVAGAVTRHARVVLVLWLIAIAALALKGIGLEDRLSTPPVYVDGTTSNHEHTLFQRDFGDEDALVVMLRGPQRVVNRQGRRVERALDALPRTRVVSPWRPDGSIEGLRPDRRTAVVIVSVGRSAGQGYTDVLPPVRDTLDRVVRPPLRADLSGSPVIAAAVTDAASDAAESGVRIAVPILMVAAVLLLLLVFRSVIAAAIPAIIGGTTVVASRGAMDLLSGTVDLDALAVGLVAMIGLALGMGYSLLVVSRFREEARGTGDLAEAVQTAVATTGRAALLAGAALLLTMVVAAQLIPGAIVDAAAFAVVIASVFSVAAAIFVVPAMLTLLGPRLERSSRADRRPEAEPGAAHWSRGLARRPELIAPVIVFLLLAGTAAALALDTGPSSVGLLPRDDPGRVQYEAVEHKLGPGWGAPLEVMVDGRQRPVTEPARLTALARFEGVVERDPGVVTMAGLSRVERSVRPLRRLPGQLDDFQRQLVHSKRGFAHLDHGVARAHLRAGEVSSGLADAATGAAQLDSETGRTTTGAQQLASGLRSTKTGSEQLVTGLNRASEDSGQLARAASSASAGAEPLNQGLAEAKKTADSLPDTAAVLRDALTGGGSQMEDASKRVDRAQEQLAAAWSALRRMTSARTDPQYRTAIQAVEEASITAAGVDPSTGEPPDGGDEGVGAGVKDAAGEFDLGLYLGNRMTASGREASSGIGRLSRAVTQLDDGLGQLADGSDRIAAGFGRLRTGGDQFAPALAQLSEGAAALANGLGEAQSGTGSLAEGLGSGASDSGALVSGLGRIGRGVRRERRSAFADASGVGRLRRRSPDLFHSGYFLLAGIDKADARDRSQAGLVVNVDRGGHAARMLVIPTTGPLSGATRRTQERLTERADELARRTGSEVVVAGPAVALQDYDDAILARVPIVMLLLSLITVLVLVPVIRSLALPLVAALLNVLTVLATLGVLALAFNGSLLGGPGYVDAIVVGTIVPVIFGLSIGYELFVLARMREEYVSTGDPELAIEDGLRHTGRAVTVAAAIMIAVFAAFAISPFASIRSIGVGLAVAVFISAFVVRLVALPVVMQLLGDRSWWLPGWLDRLLPQSGGGAGRRVQV